MTYALRKQCKLCPAMAEYTLKQMPLCEYHFIKLNNDVFSRDGIEQMSALMRLIE